MSSPRILISDLISKTFFVQTCRQNENRFQMSKVKPRPSEFSFRGSAQGYFHHKWSTFNKDLSIFYRNPLGSYIIGIIVYEKHFLYVRGRARCQEDLRLAIDMLPVKLLYRCLGARASHPWLALGICVIINTGISYKSMQGMDKIVSSYLYPRLYMLKPVKFICL